MSLPHSIKLKHAGVESIGLVASHIIEYLELWQLSRDEALPHILKLSSLLPQLFQTAWKVMAYRPLNNALEFSHQCKIYNVLLRNLPKLLDHLDIWSDSEQNMLGPPERGLARKALEYVPSSSGSYMPNQDNAGISNSLLVLPLLPISSFSTIQFPRASSMPTSAVRWSET